MKKKKEKDCGYSSPTDKTRTDEWAVRFLLDLPCTTTNNWVFDSFVVLNECSRREFAPLWRLRSVNKKLPSDGLICLYKEATQVQSVVEQIIAKTTWDSPSSLRFVVVSDMRAEEHTMTRDSLFRRFWESRRRPGNRKEISETIRNRHKMGQTPPLRRLWCSWWWYLTSFWKCRRCRVAATHEANARDADKEDGERWERDFSESISFDSGSVCVIYQEQHSQPLLSCSEKAATERTHCHSLVFFTNFFLFSLVTKWRKIKALGQDL